MITRWLPLLLFGMTSAHGDDTAAWPQFRGPGSTCVADGQKVAVEFGPGKHLRWKVESPTGSSSPIIWGDRLFLTGFTDPKLETLCYDRRDGKLLWRREVRYEKLETYYKPLGSPAASTCATDGLRVVSYFGSFGLICHDLEGRELWTKHLPLPVSKDGFGTGTSPIIHKGLVYLLRDEDGPGRGLYAFDVRTGEQIWKANRDGFRVSFGMPVVWGEELVTVGDLQVKGYDLKSGEERWRVTGVSAYPCTTPTVGADGHLYVATYSPGSKGSPDQYPPLRRTAQAFRQGRGRQAVHGGVERDADRRIHGRL